MICNVIDLVRKDKDGKDVNIRTFLPLDAKFKSFHIDRVHPDQREETRAYLSEDSSESICMVLGINYIARRFPEFAKAHNLPCRAPLHLDATFGLESIRSATLQRLRDLTDTLGDLISQAITTTNDGRPYLMNGIETIIADLQETFYAAPTKAA